MLYSRIFFANLSAIVFPYLDGKKENVLLSPTHVALNPAKTFLFNLFKFLNRYIIEPIVSGIKTKRYVKFLFLFNKTY